MQWKLTAGVSIAFLGGAVIGEFAGFGWAAISVVIFVIAVIATEHRP
jgi:hypothetical protein